MQQQGVKITSQRSRLYSVFFLFVLLVTGCESLLSSRRGIGQDAWLLQLQFAKKLPIGELRVVVRNQSGDSTSNISSVSLIRDTDLVLVPLLLTSYTSSGLYGSIADPKLDDVVVEFIPTGDLLAEAIQVSIEVVSISQRRIIANASYGQR
jgi:hypothetical protein